jgi:hypothetical protein
MPSNATRIVKVTLASDQATCLYLTPFVAEFTFSIPNNCGKGTRTVDVSITAHPDAKSGDFTFVERPQEGGGPAVDTETFHITIAADVTPTPTRVPTLVAPTVMPSPTATQAVGGDSTPVVPTVAATQVIGGLETPRAPMLTPGATQAIGGEITSTPPTAASTPMASATPPIVPGIKTSDGPLSADGEAQRGLGWAPLAGIAGGAVLGGALAFGCLGTRAGIRLPPYALWETVASVPLCAVPTMIGSPINDCLLDHRACDRCWPNEARYFWNGKDLKGPEGSSQTPAEGYQQYARKRLDPAKWGITFNGWTSMWRRSCGQGQAFVEAELLSWATAKHKGVVQKVEAPKNEYVRNVHLHAAVGEGETPCCHGWEAEAKVEVGGIVEAEDLDGAIVVEVNIPYEAEVRLSRLDPCHRTADILKFTDRYKMQFPLTGSSESKSLPFGIPIPYVGEYLGKLVEHATEEHVGAEYIDGNETREDKGAGDFRDTIDLVVTILPAVLKLSYQGATAAKIRIYARATVSKAYVRCLGGNCRTMVLEEKCDK